MDLKGLVDKAKAALKGNPDLIEKGGDAIDKATGGNRLTTRAAVEAADSGPFAHGVASGDPLPDGVVLWTRLALDPLAHIEWLYAEGAQMAADTTVCEIQADARALLRCDRAEGRRLLMS